uniref:E3 ubiquitin-protein ligase RNF181-like n=1 Tax=Fragaria vesca subsp. vesca TaxID=101020 RepID=UPI0005C9E1C1|nr:PREDICTED: E3 ubiquitin-protein ligase RNF181-like [Fragaria vesca subsp. vesca]
MGCFFSCFDVNDPLDNTQNANNANDGNRIIIPNLYNKIASVNEVALGSIQCETGRDAATATAIIRSLPGDPFLIEKEIGGQRYLYPSSIEEEECPTCLEEYTPDNPKIKTKCCHHFHLACIYEWLERKQTCPVCSQVMSFNDL